MTWRRPPAAPPCSLPRARDCTPACCAPPAPWRGRARGTSNPIRRCAPATTRCTSATSPCTPPCGRSTPELHRMSEPRTSGVLNAADRDRGLQTLAGGGVDVLVVGGGITGAGAALDAASRGLAVALVVRADLACGALSKSIKLIHVVLGY